VQAKPSFFNFPGEVGQRMKDTLATNDAIMENESHNKPAPPLIDLRMAELEILQEYMLSVNTNIKTHSLEMKWMRSKLEVVGRQNYQELQRIR